MTAVVSQLDPHSAQRTQSRASVLCSHTAVSVWSHRVGRGGSAAATLLLPTHARRTWVIPGKPEEAQAPSGAEPGARGSAPRGVGRSRATHPNVGPRESRVRPARASGEGKWICDLRSRLRSAGKVFFLVSSFFSGAACPRRRTSPLTACVLRLQMCGRDRALRCGDGGEGPRARGSWNTRPTYHARGRGARAAKMTRHRAEARARGRPRARSRAGGGDCARLLSATNLTSCGRRAPFERGLSESLLACPR